MTVIRWSLPCSRHRRRHHRASQGCRLETAWIARRFERLLCLQAVSQAWLIAVLSRSIAYLLDRYVHCASRHRSRGSMVH